MSQVKPVSSPTSAGVVALEVGVGFAELDFVAECEGWEVELEVGSGAQPDNANKEIESTATLKIAWFRLRAVSIF